MKTNEIYITKQYNLVHCRAKIQLSNN